jgi:hypothetical protein
LALAAGLTSTRGAVRILVYVGSDIDHVGLWIMSDYVRTVAVLEYVDGHFELKQSDMILHAVLGTGPLDRRGCLDFQCDLQDIEECFCKLFAVSCPRKLG